MANKTNPENTVEFTTADDSQVCENDVYENDMYMYADDYINSFPEDMRERIYSNRGNMFTGMIKYINKHIMFDKDVIYNNINTLNDIWNTYTSLAYMYNQNPVLEEYCMLIGCSRSTLYSWMNGETRDYIYKDIDGNVINDFFRWNNAHRGEEYTKELCSSRSDIIKKWAEECKIGRYKSAAAGNVGGIFLCKAIDGMVETAPVQTENKEQVRSIEQIKQEILNAHATKQITDSSSVSIPPKADF